MKLLGFCVVAVFITTVSSAAVDVERTIQQVQSILKDNSLLPRLSRDEILELLNDIKSEDATRNASSKQIKEITSKDNFDSNVTKTNNSEVKPQPLNINENLIDEKDIRFTDLPSVQLEIETTTKSGTTLMVVLPYTPRDGSSLQELYTKPPRTEVVPVTKTTEKTFSLNQKQNFSEVLKTNAKIANNKKQELPKELQDFLNAHGLKGNPEQDHFLLPLDGFKPLPPIKTVDESVKLPENILLTYDLISSSSELKAHANTDQVAQHNQFLFEPLHPEFPFELDMSPSELQEVVYPYDLPKTRKTKSIAISQNYEPIDYESVKVIPLNKGPNPSEEVKSIIGSDQTKRQTNVSTSESSDSTTTTTTTTTSESTTTQTVADSKVADTPLEPSSAASGTDSGASISDLEDSFGGAAPETPGDSELPPPKKNGFYWMLDWNSFLEVGDGRTKVNIHFEPKLGDPQMFIPVTVP